MNPGFRRVSPQTIITGVRKHLGPDASQRKVKFIRFPVPEGQGSTPAPWPPAPCCGIKARRAEKKAPYPIPLQKGPDLRVWPQLLISAGDHSMRPVSTPSQGLPLGPERAPTGSPPLTLPHQGPHSSLPCQVKNKSHMLERLSLVSQT